MSCICILEMSPYKSNLLLLRELYEAKIFMRYSFWIKILWLSSLQSRFENSSFSFYFEKIKNLNSIEIEII
jgi:hypothetical protein